MSQSSNAKSMTIGESGLAVVFAVTAFLCVIASAKALDAPFAFHAALSAAASLASVFVILNRYFDRPAERAPVTCSASRRARNMLSPNGTPTCG
jgi:cytochrome c oxidase cbb3-type subunit 1